MFVSLFVVRRCPVPIPWFHLYNLKTLTIWLALLAVTLPGIRGYGVIRLEIQKLLKKMHQSVFLI